MPMSGVTFTADPRAENTYFGGSDEFVPYYET